MVEVNSRNFQIHGRLATSLILGADKPVGFVGVFGLQAGLPVLFGVETIEHPVPSLEQMIPLFHRLYAFLSLLHSQSGRLITSESLLNV